MIPTQAQLWLIRSPINDKRGSVIWCNMLVLALLPTIYKIGENCVVLCSFMVRNVCTHCIFLHLLYFFYFILQDCGVGKDDLTQIELQICVDYVNSVVQEETDREYLVFFFCILALDNDEKWLSEPRPLVC